MGRQPGPGLFLEPHTALNPSGQKGSPQNIQSLLLLQAGLPQLPAILLHLFPQEGDPFSPSFPDSAPQCPQSPHRQGAAPFLSGLQLNLTPSHLALSALTGQLLPAPVRPVQSVASEWKDDWKEGQNGSTHQSCWFDK